jgi:hypothetical protein
MNKLYPLFALCVFTLAAKAQKAVPDYQPYGKIDVADLAMQSCDFEKDANAEVLIEKGDLYFDQSLNVVMDYHKRIKIFNDNGKGQANIRLEFINFEHSEYITGLQAETINLVDGKPEITKLDKKQIYTQPIDKYRSALIFTMPNVKPGSIIEFKYTFANTSFSRIPTWFFQEDIPVKYSDFTTSIPEWFYFSTQTHTHLPYAKHTNTAGNGSIMVDNTNIPFTSEVEQRVIVNIPSLPDEPFMSSSADNLQRISFVLTSFRPPYGFVQNYSNTWAKVGGILADDEDFGLQLKRKLTGEDALIDKAKTLKTDDDKIAFLFNAVKNTMKWNGEDHWYTNDGTCKAWDNKTGNSTEINLILYHLLKKSGVANALPMVVSTRNHGKVSPAYTFLYQFNRGVVYIPVDSTKMYILDATGKYNIYNHIPYNLLNSSGLYINMDKKTYSLVFLDQLIPVIQSIYTEAEIKPDGKMQGTTQISCLSYNRINAIDHYKTDGETKYIDHLRGDDNNLKVASLKMENMDVDTLPLVQNISFNLDLTGSDDNYIYFVPNLFTSLRKNPFLSESRFTDIDFGYMNNTIINGRFKIPAGYKVDAMPQSVAMSLPDHAITFKRIFVEQEGTIVVRYQVMYKKSIYFKEQYQDFHDFYKRMYELLNEQVVLKKS